MGQIQFDESQQTGPPIRDGHVARVQDNTGSREVVPHLYQTDLASNKLITWEFFSQFFSILNSNNLEFRSKLYDVVHTPAARETRLGHLLCLLFSSLLRGLPGDARQIRPEVRPLPPLESRQMVPNIYSIKMLSFVFNIDQTCLFKQ